MLHHCYSSCNGCQCQNEWLSNFASWCIAVCMISALNTSWRTSGSCRRFILASDCIRPPVPMSWFLPHADLHLATAHSQLQELEHGMHYLPVSPPHHIFPRSGSSWRHFFSSDNCVNNTNYCVVVLKCFALGTTLILANWTELNWTPVLQLLIIASHRLQKLLGQPVHFWTLYGVIFLQWLQHNVMCITVYSCVFLVM